MKRVPCIVYALLIFTCLSTVTSGQGRNSLNRSAILAFTKRVRKFPFMLISSINRGIRFVYVF